MNNCQRCGKVIKEGTSNSEKNKGRFYRGCGTKACFFEWVDKSKEPERVHRTFSEFPPASIAAVMPTGRAEFNSPLPYYTHREPTPEPVLVPVVVPSTVAAAPTLDSEKMVLSAIFKMVNAQVHEDLELLKKQIAEEITKRDIQQSEMQHRVDFIAKFVGLEKPQEAKRHRL